MKTQGNKTFMGTVVFLDLGEAASASPAPELHQRVREVVSRTVGHLPATERILLDTGNGAVVCFPGDPEDAVFVAIGIRDSLQQETATFPDIQVRLGVNLGPVKVLEEKPGHTQLLGEGMHGAEALLSFASPSQILASRSFFELVRVSRTSTGSFFTTMVPAGSRVPAMWTSTSWLRWEAPARTADSTWPAAGARWRPPEASCPSSR
jgi:class 3 adenylate cyclase